MPTPTLSTFMIKQIFEYLLLRNISARKTSIALGIARSSISDYNSRAQAIGLTTWAAIEPLSEAELASKLSPAKASELLRADPDFEYIHTELKRKGMTLMLLWQEHIADHPNHQTVGYTQLSVLYRKWKQKLKKSMRQNHRAGEKLFADFAGPTLKLADGSVAHIFVAALGASKYTYAAALPSQKTVDWVQGMTNALHFIGGIPEMIVPDQPKTVVRRPDRYEPLLSRSVLDFAQHYDLTVLPARPAKPQDKAIVESAVQVVERWILMRMRKMYLPDLGAAQKAIAELLVQLNRRPFQKISGSRATLFEEIDRPALKPLPGERYEYASFKNAKVHIDYHIEVDGHYYSVPHALVQQHVQVRIGRQLLDVLHAGKVVARHLLSDGVGRYTTLDEHMPSNHLAHRNWTPPRLIEWGMRMGAAVGAVIEKLMGRFKHPEQGYRSALGLLNLHKQYGTDRLNGACELALRLGTSRYKHIQAILKNGRDLVSEPPPKGQNWQSPEHSNVRGARYYH